MTATLADLRASATYVPAPAALIGHEIPRVYTPPLRELTPQTSLGYEAIQFAEQVLGLELYPWQKWWLIHAYELAAGSTTSAPRLRFRTLVTLVARQNGKALDVDTPMLTTAGWSTMGELREGDEVFHPDGHPTRVVGAFDVMHGRHCYRVTTTDGRSIVADADHLWTVQDRRRATRVGGRHERAARTYQWETLTTEQLLARGVMRFERPRASGGVQREFAYRLPVQRAVTSKPIDLPIDPYLLGAWLGDGTSAGTGFTVGDQDLDETRGLLAATGARIVSTRRDGSCWHLQLSLDDRRRKVCTFRTALDALQVLGNKHVPDLYLTAGVEQRLALLQGLMDTDGSVSKAGQAEFCAMRRELAEAVLYLARSLGWRATMIQSAAMLNGIETGRRWRVTFTPTRSVGVPFRLRRKVERVRDAQGDRSAVSIASIESVESRPVRCVKVEREDGLFLAGRDLVATHNTLLLKVVSLWSMFMGRADLVLGAAQTLDIAQEAYQGAVALAKGNPDLKVEVASEIRGNGKTCLTLANGARYKITASSDEAGRGLSVDLLILDELRAQYDTGSWAALSKTTSARPLGLIVAISNAGSDRSVVLNTLRAAALAGTEPTLGLFEWSAPEGCALDDPQAWAAANPALGHGLQESSIRTSLATDTPAVFRTEVLCQHVEALDAAIDPAAWKLCEDVTGSLAAVRDRIVYCLDVAPDGQHVTLCGAATLDDGRIRGEVFGGWTSTDDARRALPVLFAKLRPRALGWFPSGPGTVLGVDLGHQHGVTLGRWNVPRDAMLDQAPGLIELTGSDVTEACQSLADVTTGRIFLHPDNPLLNAHVTGSQRLNQGDGWRFVRRGAGHCDAAYAMAGAVRLARLLPAAAPAERPRIF